MIELASAIHCRGDKLSVELTSRKIDICKRSENRSFNGDSSDREMTRVWKVKQDMVSIDTLKVQPEIH
jgi:hypothetical protein